MLFWLPRGQFNTRFGSQEGTLAHVFQQLGHEGGNPLPPDLIFVSSDPVDKQTEVHKVPS